jgi:hypothetical protein
VRSAFAEGCAGAFVFSWTDEWHRGGFRDRRLDIRAHDALAPSQAGARGAASRLRAAPFPDDVQWPRVSGAGGPRFQCSACVSARNGARNAARHAGRARAPAVSRTSSHRGHTGSTDATPELAADTDVRLISTDNHGLSSAPATPALAGGRAARSAPFTIASYDALSGPASGSQFYTRARTAS